MDAAEVIGVLHIAAIHKTSGRGRTWSLGHFCDLGGMLKIDRLCWQEKQLCCWEKAVLEGV